MTTLCYRSWVNIKLWPREFNRSQSLILAGNLRNSRSCINEIQERNSWKYVLDNPGNEKSIKMTKAINNIMYAHWLLSS